MFAEAEFWVAVAFVIFVGVLIYFGVHKLITGALDQRSGRIRADLDEARRLKEEAAALLAEYRRKQQSAEREAAQIVAGAKAEADRLGGRGQDADGGVRGAPHQDGGNQDRAGRGTGAG